MKLTEGQHKLLELLSDGKRHSKEEIKTQVFDEYMSDPALRAALIRLNVKLETIGERVICESQGHYGFYRHVRLLHAPE